MESLQYVGSEEVSNALQELARLQDNISLLNQKKTVMVSNMSEVEEKIVELCEKRRFVLWLQSNVLKDPVPHLTYANVVPAEIVQNDTSFITQNEQTDNAQFSPSKTSKMTATHASAFSKESSKPQMDRESFLMSLLNKVNSNQMSIEDQLNQFANFQIKIGHRDVPSLLTQIEDDNLRMLEELQQLEDNRIMLEKSEVAQQRDEVIEQIKQTEQSIKIMQKRKLELQAKQRQMKEATALETEPASKKVSAKE